MPSAAIRQIWECPTCHERYEAPLAASEVVCRNALKTTRDSYRKHVMKLIWEKGDGPMPGVVLVEGGR